MLAQAIGFFGEYSFNILYVLPILLILVTIVFWYQLWGSNADITQRWLAAAVYPVIFIIVFGSCFYLAKDCPNLSSQVDILSKAAIPLVAAIYFLYQAFSGAFFATTSVSVAATWDDKSTNTILITTKIDRGSNWLVDISEDKYAITTTANELINWESLTGNDLNFPGRIIADKRVLRLAPNESTQTVVTKAVDPPYANGCFVTTKIKYNSVSWPFPAESYARTYLAKK